MRQTQKDAPMLPVKNKKYSQGKIDLQDARIVYINRVLGNLWQVRFHQRQYFKSKKRQKTTTKTPKRLILSRQFTILQTKIIRV
jgi:hypothetical protein